MRLYFSSGACSLAPHIVLRELGFSFDLVRASGSPRALKDGTLLSTINPKGAVPTLVLDDGQVLTEGVVMTQYLADRKPEAKLAPPPGTFERLRLQEWLNYLASDVHKGFSPLFSPKATDEWKALCRTVLGQRLQVLEARLAKTPYLMGDSLSVADPYLFTLLGWSGRTGMDLKAFPALQAFQQRVADRPTVSAALAAEAQA